MANMLRTDFIGWRAVGGLNKVSMRQKFGNHTLFFLDYDIPEKRRHLLPPENTPFRVQMGRTPLGTSTFFGYVNHAEGQVDTGGRRLTRLVGLGTSKVMNNALPSTWEGQTRTAMLRDLVARYRFRAVVYSHPEVLNAWSTGTMTDFRAANLLAEQMGYRLWIDGSTAWLLDPARVLTEASPMSTSVVRAVDQQSGTVLTGSNVPGSVLGSKRTVQYGISGTSGEVIVSTSGDRSLPTEVLSSPANSFGAGAYDASALARNRQDSASVTSKVDGNIALFPGAPVRFDTSTSPDQTGLWLVNESFHEITNTEFTTTVTASRDKDRPLLSRSPNVVRREGNVPSVIRNGVTWEAEVQESVYV